MAKKKPILYAAVKSEPLGLLHGVVRNLSIIALSLLGAVFLSEEIYRHLAMPQNVILIYVLAILIISAFTSYIYSIAGTLAAVILYDYMITAPRLGFSVTIGFPITMVIMLIVSLTTCTLVAKIKAIAVEALEANRKTETVYRLIRNFIDAGDQESLMSIAGQEVLEHLHRSVFFYLGDPDREDTRTWLAQAAPGVDSSLFTSPAHRRAVSMVYAGHEYGIPARSPLSYRRLATGGVPLGVMCIHQGDTPLKKDEEDLLEMIAVQMSIILEKLNIAEYRQKAEIRAEREQTRSSFLRGISHDLRSPLTSILGAVSMLKESGGTVICDPSALELLDGICSDTDWLLRMVENILTITRLQSENMKVCKKMEAPEELIAYAVNTVRKRHQSRRIDIVAPEELILVPMDPILITQVLINFLENAHRHSPPQSEITVTLTICERGVRISVEDLGPGIDPAEDRDLFEIDPRQGGTSEDASRGRGMGLSICKTIVAAHGGEIGVQNRAQTGACFWFILPLHP